MRYRAKGRYGGGSVRTAGVILALILCVAVVLRLWGLGEQSLWLDEAFSWNQSRSGIDRLLRMTAQDNYPPLHNLLLAGTMAVIGDSEWALRLPSAILGSGTVVALYLAARALRLDPAVGLVSALLLAMAPFHIWYSQEARMYALLAFAGTGFAAATASTALALDAKRRWWAAAASAIFGATLLYSHVFGVATWLAVIVGGLLLSTERQSRLAIIVCAALAFGCFAPWLAVLAVRTGRIVAEGFWITPLTWGSFWREVSSLLGGHLGFGAALVGIVSALILAARGRETAGRVVLFLACWAFAPIAVGVIVSLTAVPLFISRYLIAALPPLLLVSTLGWFWVLRRHVLLAVGAVSGALLFSSVLAMAPGDRSEWRPAVQYARTFIDGAEDCLIFQSYSARVPFSYYHPIDESCLIEPDQENAVAVTAGVRRVVLVSHLARGRELATLNSLAAAGWQVRDRASFRHIDVYALSPQ